MNQNANLAHASQLQGLQQFSLRDGAHGSGRRGRRDRAAAAAAVIGTAQCHAHGRNRACFGDQCSKNKKPETKQSKSSNRNQTIKNQAKIIKSNTTERGDQI